MSGSLRNVRRKPCSRASCSSPEPGSVMATNALPSLRRDQKCLNSDSVSMVPPDFGGALVTDGVGERLQVGELLGHRVDDRQPAEAVGDLRLPGRAPERVV